MTILYLFETADLTLVWRNLFCFHRFDDLDNLKWSWMNSVGLGALCYKHQNQKESWSLSCIWATGELCLRKSQLCLGTRSYKGSASEQVQVLLTFAPFLLVTWIFCYIIVVVLCIWWLVLILHIYHCCRVALQHVKSHTRASSEFLPDLDWSRGLAVGKPSLAIAGAFSRGVAWLFNRYRQKARLAKPKPSHTELWHHYWD